MNVKRAILRFLKMRFDVLYSYCAFQIESGFFDIADQQPSPLTFPSIIMYDLYAALSRPVSAA